MLHFLRVPLVFIFALIFLTAFGETRAETIDDAAFFSSLTHTFIDFETRGDGIPHLLDNGTTGFLPPDEYASLGVVFNSSVPVVNDGSIEWDLAQSIVGSPDNGIAITNFVGSIGFNFVTPVTSFGLAVVVRPVPTVNPVFLDAFDSDGGLIESVEFTSDFVDGTTAGFANYGFLGISSDTSPIYSGQIRARRTALADDLRFVAIPEPSSLAVLLLSCGLAGIRRRRSAG